MRVANRPAYKTGTSYGYRDALAVGVAGGYAVMVWTGRPDGGARADATGRDSAGPLLFDTFDLLRAPSQAPQAIAPPGAPPALQTLDAAQGRLSILFPPNGATVYVETAGRRTQGLNVVRPLKLSAHSATPIQWYVDGQPLKPDADGEFDWSPPQEGFYDLIVANDAGQSAKSHVRVVAIPTGGRP